MVNNVYLPNELDGNLQMAASENHAFFIEVFFASSKLDKTFPWIFPAKYLNIKILALYRTCIRKNRVGKSASSTRNLFEDLFYRETFYREI